MGFYVLALLIVEATIGFVLVASDLEKHDKFIGLWLAVGMVVLVIAVVTLLVWSRPQNITFDREAHLIDRGKVPFGSDAHELTPSELTSLSTKTAVTSEDDDV